MRLLKIIAALVIVSFTQVVLSQEITQTIRGKVVDKITMQPLIGANIIVINSDPLIGTTTDTDGRFRLENIETGRVGLKISFVGYHDKVLSNLLLTSGKELVLEVKLEEKPIIGKEIEIKARRNKFKPLNEMATLSTRSFSVEETQRYAGSRNDVARMASGFAGVRISDDSRNDIVIRGNSPIGLLWRLEGIDIPNPNHYGALGTTGGPVCILNNNLLNNSDFMTGAFPAEYGNAIAGVFDLQMRPGNNEQFEFLGQMGFNGIELGAEGPISKEKGSSFLINYRYSTLEIFDALGIDFGTGTAVPKYQDLSFKINLPNTKLGNFSIFGIGGISDIAFLESEKDTTQDKIDFYSGEGIDLTNGSDMAALGLNHRLKISKTSYTKFSLALTYHKFRTDTDSIIPKTFELFPVYRNDFTEVKIFSSLELVKKINSRHNFKTGIIATRYNFNLSDSAYNSSQERFVTITNYDGATYLLQSYLQWQYKISNTLTLNPGIHYQHFTLNGSNEIEPRLGIQWDMAPTHSLSLAYGTHSQLMPVTVYFNQKEIPEGGIQRINENLDMLKSRHIVLGYKFALNEFTQLKTELYYQSVSQAAVNGNKPSPYSILNQGANFYIAVPDTLVNDGTGYNYGLEMSLERSLHNGLYYLLNASLYQSKYKGSDEVERNTAFNGNYVVNALVGKDFSLTHLFKKSNKKFNLTIDLKATFAGGQRYTPINVEKSMEEDRRVYYENLAYGKQYKDYFRTDFRIALRQNSRKITMEWAIDFQNIFNVKNIYSRRFNLKTGEFKDIYQLGILIVPQFRIEF